MPNKTAEVHFLDDKMNNKLEILVPAGLSHKELGKITLAELLSRFRPSGCGACLSGQHFNIREKFEKVLQIDLAAGKVG